MRKTLSAALALGLLVGAFAAPAAAGKKKVHETFEAQALPLPNLSSATGTERRSCFAGVEGVHWVATEFKAPGKGTLRAYMEGFTGDWDLALELENGTIVYAVGDQLAGGAPASEEALAVLGKGDTVKILACNYLGEPGPIEVHYEGTFKT